MMDSHSYREWLNEMFRHYSETEPDDFEADDYQPLDETGTVPDSWNEPDDKPDLDADLPF
jgi:hypothetical protein